MDRLNKPEQIEGSDNQRHESAALDARIRDAKPVSDRPDGVRNVELSRINQTDINSAADFKSQEQYHALHREAQMLKQMQPALDKGADVETFHSWDQTNQIGAYSQREHIRGYADVYHSYHGDEAIALDPQPDGTYDVINGRHRLVAARDAGLHSVPAKVTG
jgi:hypothetical protein